MTSRLALVATGSATAVLLVACSGAASDTSADGELTSIRVGAIPIVDTAAVWVGLSQGFFVDEGLELTVEHTAGGVPAVAGVLSGTYDFAFGNTVSLMVARDHGHDVRYVANGASASGETDGFGAVVVPEDSDIDDAADLEGTLVSVNNAANITGVTVSHAVEDAGGDPDGMEFVEIPFPDAPAAIADAHVDAAVVVEPFLTLALDRGARVVCWNFQTIPDLDVAGYFAAGELIDGRPELVERFRRAMNRSLQFAEQHPEVVREVVGDYTDIDDGVRDRMVLPTFRAEFNREALATLADAVLRYELIDEAADLDALLSAVH